MTVVVLVKMPQGVVQAISDFDGDPLTFMTAADATKCAAELALVKRFGAYLVDLDEETITKFQPE